MFLRRPRFDERPGAWPSVGDCIGCAAKRRRASALARGRLAQLVEHLVYTERVGGSSPSPPTIVRAAALIVFLLASLGLARAENRGPMTFMAAPLATLCDSKCPDVVVASGVIDAETPAVFHEFAARAALSPGRPVLLYLDSPGGNVAASMELGAEFRRLRVAAIIGRYAVEGGVSGAFGGQCASACVYAWMGAVRRVAPPASRVALHRMSEILDAGGRTFADRRLIAIVERYAAHMGVSPRIVAMAESLAPDQMWALTPSAMLQTRLATSPF